MSSQQLRNDEPINHRTTAKFYEKLSRLHLEMARVYAELASQEPRIQTEDKVVSIKGRSGELLANLRLSNSEAKAEVANPLPTDNAPFAWLKNHLKAMAEKRSLRLKLDEQDQVLRSIALLGNITPDLAKELQSALRWALSRMVAASNASKEAGVVCEDRGTRVEQHPSRADEEGTSSV
jgi:hypothetical protein